MLSLSAGFPRFYIPSLERFCVLSCLLNAVANKHKEPLEVTGYIPQNYFTTVCPEDMCRTLVLKRLLWKRTNPNQSSCNSSLGTVMLFSGLTLDLAIKREQWPFPVTSSSRAHEHCS